LSDARSRTFITAADLAAAVDANAAVVLLDVRDKQIDPPVARPLIPGAITAYLASDFSGPPSARAGSRPLPDIDDLQAKARHWGISADSLVVVYDDSAGAQAGRAWWTLRWAGIDNVRLLDGGIKAWIDAGRQVVDTPAAASKPGNIALSAGHMPTLNADQAAKLARDGVLLDARGRAAYIGAPAEAGKPPTGHIPGALSAPSAESIAADGHFKSTEDLRARFAGLGVDGNQPVGVYCGSGNSASHLIAGLSAIGIDAPLYVGSWSAWSADPARPVATGAEPGSPDASKPQVSKPQVSKP
jgi:thiosulfate/3-mercaptopyruvate sulfurtransferase